MRTTTTLRRGGAGRLRSLLRPASDLPAAHKPAVAAPAAVAVAAAAAAADAAVVEQPQRPQEREHEQRRRQPWRQRQQPLWQRRQEQAGSAAEHAVLQAHDSPSWQAANDAHLCPAAAPGWAAPRAQQTHHPLRPPPTPEGTCVKPTHPAGRAAASLIGGRSPGPVGANEGPTAGGRRRLPSQPRNPRVQNLCPICPPRSPPRPAPFNRAHATRTGSEPRPHQTHRQHALSCPHPAHTIPCPRHTLPTPHAPAA